MGNFPYFYVICLCHTFYKTHGIYPNWIIITIQLNYMCKQQIINNDLNDYYIT